MGTTYWNGHLDDKEDNHLPSKASELKCSEHPLVVEVKFPFPNYLSFVDYIRFVRVSKYLEGYQTDLSEDKVSNPRRLLCRTTSLYNLPDKMRFSDSLVGNLKDFRRTRSTNDLCDFFVEYASAAASGKVITSPSGQRIFDSVERTLMASSLLKSSLFYQLGAPEIAIRPFRTRSFSTSPLKICGLSSSESKPRNALSQEPENEVTSPIGQIPKLKASKSLDSSIANSRSSYQLNPSSCPFVSKGLLRCVWKNGSLKILFSEENDRGNVYVASSYKIESSSRKHLDYMYSFRLRTGNETSQFVGKMKVLSSLILHPNQSRITETEFVLFGAQEDRSREMHECSSSIVEKSRGFSKKVADIFRPHNFSKHKPTSKAGGPTLQTEIFLQNLSCDYHESELANHLKNGFPHNLELATIVIKSSQQDSNKEAAVGGWGLKFLEKVAGNRPDDSIDSTLHPESCEESHVKNRYASERSMKVLIPADIHGGPIAGNDGPSSLIERWRSGHCDCGGWDLGCPLTVLHDAESGDSKSISTEDMQENCKSVNFFIGGKKHGEPTLRMVNIGEGLYAMHFQRTLSSLQAFSVGVAVIHSQTPALYPQF